MGKCVFFMQKSNNSLYDVYCKYWGINGMGILFQSYGRFRGNMKTCVKIASPQYSCPYSLVQKYFQTHRASLI